jgi:hypothetical protein
MYFGWKAIEVYTIFKSLIEYTVFRKTGVVKYLAIRFINPAGP